MYEFLHYSSYFKGASYSATSLVFDDVDAVDRHESSRVNIFLVLTLLLLLRVPFLPSLSFLLAASRTGTRSRVKCKESPSNVSSGKQFGLDTRRRLRYPPGLRMTSLCNCAIVVK